MPNLLEIKKAKKKKKKIILKSFGNPKATKKDLEKAVKIIKNLGIEDTVRGTALGYAEKARKSLNKYSGSAKNELIALLDFVVKRSL